MSIDPRITRAFEAQNGFALEPHLIVLALMGSHSHGTYLPAEEPEGTCVVMVLRTRAQGPGRREPAVTGRRA